MQEINLFGSKDSLVVFEKNDTWDTARAKVVLMGRKAYKVINNSKLTSMGSMFLGCKATSLDLSSFSTEDLVVKYSMFTDSCIDRITLGSKCGDLFALVENDTVAIVM